MSAAPSPHMTQMNTSHENAGAGSALLSTSLLDAELEEERKLSLAMQPLHEDDALSAAAMLAQAAKQAAATASPAASPYAHGTSSSLTSSPALPASSSSTTATTHTHSEFTRMQAELRTSDLLISELNRDNLRLHNEMKILEKQYRLKFTQSSEENNKLRLELHAQQAEVARLTSLHNGMLDPGARDQLSLLHAQLKHEQEAHHHNVCLLRAELDKLRGVKLELSVRKEDATMLGKESLRLTLESVQEKYASYKEHKAAEVKELHTKLQWYIENQQLISEYESQLTAVKQECEKLRDENLCMNHLIPPGTKLEGGATVAGAGGVSKLKPRPVDVKKIKELEAKVAELTDIIKRKGAAPSAPSSSAAAIAAAAAAASAPSVAGVPAPSSSSVNLTGLISALKPTLEEHELISALRTRLAETEAALSKCDTEHSARIRSLRQESDQVKLLYEKRAAKLQKELADAQKKIPLTGRNKLNRIAELERQLDDTRAHFRTRIRKIKNGERDEEEEEGGETGGAEQDKENVKKDSKGNSPHKSPAGDAKRAPASMDEQKYPSDERPLPAQQRPATADADIPRSPLRAHPHPHHPPSGDSSTGTRDFLLYKQSLDEQHEKDLHLLTTRYESQLTQARLQWESQIHTIRHTHESDCKLQQSFLHAAQDEVVRARASLEYECARRQELHTRCLQLESDLQRVRHEPDYIAFKELESRVSAMTHAWNAREAEYTQATEKTLAEAHQERALMHDRLRHKTDQLSTAAVRFQQLTQALKHLQAQLQAQKQLMAQQEENQREALAKQHEFMKQQIAAMQEEAGQQHGGAGSSSASSLMTMMSNMPASVSTFGTKLRPDAFTNPSRHLPPPSALDEAFDPYAELHTISAQPISILFDPSMAGGGGGGSSGVAPAAGADADHAAIVLDHASLYAAAERQNALDSESLAKNLPTDEQLQLQWEFLMKA